MSLRKTGFEAPAFSFRSGPKSMPIRSTPSLSRWWMVRGLPGPESRSPLEEALGHADDTHLDPHLDVLEAAQGGQQVGDLLLDSGRLADYQGHAEGVILHLCPAAALGPGRGSDRIGNQPDETILQGLRRGVLVHGDDEVRDRVDCLHQLGGALRLRGGGGGRAGDGLGEGGEQQQHGHGQDANGHERMPPLRGRGAAGEVRSPGGRSIVIFPRRATRIPGAGVVRGLPGPAHTPNAPGCANRFWWPAVVPPLSLL